MMFLKRNSIIKKLRNIGYLNRGIIFTLDLLLAVCSALLSLMVMYFFMGTVYYRNGNAVIMIVAFTFVLSAGLLLATALYKVSIRCSTLRELNRIFLLVALKALLMGVFIGVFRIFYVKYAIGYILLDMLLTTFLMIAVRSFIVNLYHIIMSTGGGQETHVNNTLVYGAHGNAPLLATQINDNRKSPYKVVGFLAPGGKEERVLIAGQRVHRWDGDPATLEVIVDKLKVANLLFTDIVDFNHERDRLVDFCIEHNIQMLMGGGVQPLNKKNISNHIKPVEIEDLLYREEIGMDVDRVSRYVAGKTVLVTGAAGSIGHEIALQLAHFDVKRLVLLDIAETPLHSMELELREAFPNKDIVFVLSDVRSDSRIKKVFEKYKPNYVFHAAAYKHVPVIESHPCEGVLTNIGGTINTARYAMLNGAEKFVMISTDKAINPTNVMGASKRIAELWVQGMNAQKSDTQFVITRFGNVLGSNGSVIPLFKQQIACGGPVTVTHPEMIRYFMTISEACRLVLQAATMGNGGEIFVFDMGQQVKIDNLARRMILLSGLVPDEDIKIEYTGLRPGEKLYEELLTVDESTQLTQNERIRIALVNEVDADAVKNNVLELIRVAERSDIEQTVRMMKFIVPEFKSNNSEFEVFDQEEQFIA